MSIDPIVLKILRARGMSRREAAASLRAIQEHEYGQRESKEANYLVELLLGSNWFFLNSSSYSIEKYSIAIGKGVKLVRGDHQYQGSKYGFFLEIDGEIPATIANSLVNKPLKALIEHPFLEEKQRILAVHVSDGKTIVDIDQQYEELACIAPASARDMEIMRWKWRRMRRRQAWKVGAVEGLSFRIALNGAIKFLVATVPAIIALISVGYEGKTLFAAIAGILGISSAVIGLMMRHEMGREDGALTPRIDKMRSDEIHERREAILSGRQSGTEAVSLKLY